MLQSQGFGFDTAGGQAWTELNVGARGEGSTGMPVPGRYQAAGLGVRQGVQRTWAI